MPDLITQRNTVIFKMNATGMQESVHTVIVDNPYDRQPHGRPDV